MGSSADIFLAAMLGAILAAAGAGRNHLAGIAAPNKKAPEGAFSEFTSLHEAQWALAQTFFLVK
jgi:hypothetical protein